MTFGYTAVFAVVLIALVVVAERAIASQWGRTLHALRDNEQAAATTGIDVASRRQQIFILGAGIFGLAGAMLTTLDGQFTPGSYTPLRFTFLVWVMMIVGGAGSMRGAALGDMAVWFLWIEAEPLGHWLFAQLSDASLVSDGLEARLIPSAPYLRMVIMGGILLLVLRLAPRRQV